MVSNSLLWSGRIATYLVLTVPILFLLYQLHHKKITFSYFGIGALLYFFINHFFLNVLLSISVIKSAAFTALVSSILEVITITFLYKKFYDKKPSQKSVNSLLLGFGSIRELMLIGIYCMHDYFVFEDILNGSIYNQLAGYSENEIAVLIEQYISISPITLYCAGILAIVLIIFYLLFAKFLYRYYNEKNLTDLVIGIVSIILLNANMYLLNGTQMTVSLALVVIEIIILALIGIKRGYIQVKHKKR